MVYSLIPNAGQSLGNTRAGIKENFTTLQTAFNVDHVDLDAAGQGHHAKVDFPEGTAPTVAVDHVVMYAKDTNSRPTIFMRQENSGTEIQLSGPDPVKSQNGYTFLPGGLLLQWGYNGNTGNATVTFPVAFSATAYSVTIGSTGLGAFNGYKINSVTATTFSVLTTNIGSGFYWMAIGTI